ncbi:MAG: ferredoxin family protein [Thermoplasmata archaeon]
MTAPAADAIGTLPAGSRDPIKARKAARDPNRPGEQCRAAPGRWTPVIDRDRCEGKSDCVAVCPYSVFDLGRLTDAEYLAMGYLARLKARHHDRATSRTPRSEECRGCGLCVVACPEDAVTLTLIPGP